MIIMSVNIGSALYNRQAVTWNNDNPGSVYIDSNSATLIQWTPAQPHPNRNARNKSWTLIIIHVVSRMPTNQSHHFVLFYFAVVILPVYSVFMKIIYPCSSRLLCWHWGNRMITQSQWSSLERSLRWRHNERDGVSNHRRIHCLLNCWFRRTFKETSKLRVISLCAGNWPVTGEFPA